ncbi:hypothetical protein G7009_00865 [Pseudomonas capeferrum]|uniref:hypothetical protein n=1 Tax=Pseudomonas capeferrum TaxID=1495066 RepID=UPI0015E458D1|nr:hypothetical protein [Pseudomonas capeferrum]MBA1200356.1 hypothetical protein [Pseudomonas capeferrum]
MVTGKSFTDIDAPSDKPSEESEWLAGKDEDENSGGGVQRSRPEDRDDYIDSQVRKEDDKRPGPPDPSRASKAERYSYLSGRSLKP